MTIDELIKILENYEMFVDDDFGGSYKSVIAYAPDKKVSRAHTPIGILKIIDAFEEMQQENQELKNQLEEKENQQKEFIEWLENEIDKCKYGEENYADGDDMSYHNENELRKDILSRYKEIVGGKK